MLPSRPAAGRPVLRAFLHAIVLGALASAAPSASGQTASGDSAIRATAREPFPAGRRSAEGRREVLATRVEAIRVDGVLDEAAWRETEPARDFVQAEPLEGRLASEATEVRIAYDAQHLYVAAHLHDGDPRRLIVSEIRKDFKEEDQDDFELLLDTFGDRRNAYVFSTNVQGARHDRQVALEGREINQSWDAVWEVKTRVVPDGWTLEMRIPFRSLRFDRGSGRAWGINFSRHIRRKNEVAFWSPVPRAYNLNRVSLAGDLAGLETGNAGRDLRVKPYVAANTTRPVGSAAVPRPRSARDASIGVDVKAAVTSGLTADLTVNPDFAQVEADEQVVNLTQFSEFYPEKRDFFLENSGIFYVGDAARNNRVNPTPTPDEDNVLFFSRRIGLTTERVPVPIDGGARLTGKLGETLRIGLLDVQERRTGARPAFNSSVVRVRQNLWGNGSDVGLLFMQRLATSGPAYANRVYGVDKNIRLFGRIDWNSYAIRTESPGVTRGDYAWRSTVNYEGNFLHVKGGVMQLGEGFRNDLGYYRRTDARKWLLDTGLRPRSTWLRQHGVREIHPHVTWDYQESLAGRMLSKRLHSGNSFFFNNGAVVELSYNPAFQRLTAPFTINAKASPIPAGGYGWSDRMLYVVSDQSRALSTSFRYIWGGLWTGRQRTLNGSATIRPSYRFRATVGVQRTAADLPQGRFVSSVFTLRANYSFTTNMFVDALSQYDPSSRQFSSNVRFNLIHHPLSDLFVVYNDQRFLTADGPIPGRSLAVKFTQMMGF
jgi:hypothetical protein